MDEELMNSDIITANAAELTVEERLSALESKVSALMGEGDFELRYSGEQLDNICDKVTAISATPTNINNVVGRFASGSYGSNELKRAYEKVMPMPSAGDLISLNANFKNKNFIWGSISTDVDYNGGQCWWWGETQLIPSGAKNVAVFATCDWGGASVLGGTVSYKINGQKIKFGCLFHQMFNEVSEGTKKTTLYYLIAYNK